MENTININNNEMAIREYKGNRVVTFKDIDAVYGRAEGTARRNFNKNKQYFIEGVDYFKVCADEIRSHNEFGVSNKAHGDMVLVTESGYLMLAKSFTDDLAWTVQRELVNFYFRRVEAHPMIEEKKSASGTSSDTDECVIALGVLGAIRDTLKKAQNKDGEIAINNAIKYTAWEMSKRIIQ